MKPKGDTWVWLAAVWLCGLLFILAIFGAPSCRRFPSYWTFISQSQQYYSKVADACENLRTNTPSHLANGSKLTPESEWVPVALKKLHPNHLSVSTNGVSMTFGVSRDGYSIAWERDTQHVQTWRLSSYCDGYQKVLYARAAPQYPFSQFGTNRQN